MLRQSVGFGPLKQAKIRGAEGVDMASGDWRLGAWALVTAATPRGAPEERLPTLRHRQRQGGRGDGEAKGREPRNQQIQMPWWLARVGQENQSEDQ